MCIELDKSGVDCVLNFFETDSGLGDIGEDLRNNNLECFDGEGEVTDGDCMNWGLGVGGLIGVFTFTSSTTFRGLMNLANNQMKFRAIKNVNP